MKKKISKFMMITLLFSGMFTSFGLSPNDEKPPPVPYEFLNEI